MKKICLMACGIILAGSALGRVWTSKDGRTTEAELKSFDPASGVATFVRGDGREFKLNSNLLTEADVAYLEEWEQQEKLRRKKAAAEETEKAEIEKAKAGTIVKYVTKGDHGLSYHAYYPKGYAYDRELPILILFSPGGNGRGIIHKFKPAADTHGWIVVGCDGFKNNMDEDVGREYFEEMLPDIEANVCHNPQELYMGGMSGGAWRAYHYSAHFDRPWKGIVACGGWLGGEEYNGLEYPRKMAIAMVNGNDDNGANGWIERDEQTLKKRRCKVEVFNFDGGHVLAPSEVLSRAIEWIIDNREES